MNETPTPLDGRGRRKKSPPTTALGWSDAEVIDGDLGTSAAGFCERAGFQRMLALVASGQAGVILCLDASRLSRNSPDWASLFQLCGCFDALVADFTQVYGLSLPDDRLVLGIKGVISEMELAVMKARMRTAIESKAARGEYRFLLPAGYVHDGMDRIVMDPDQRVREAIESVFSVLTHSPSIRQVALHYRDTNTFFPVRSSFGDRGIQWVIPTHATLRKVFSNPTYAGVYVWGRTETQVDYRDGALRKSRARCKVPVEEARVFIRDHHPAYIQNS